MNNNNLKTSFFEWLKEIENESITAKKVWGDCSMHPNDQCEEVLKLVKIIKMMNYDKEFSPFLWESVSNMIK